MQHNLPANSAPARLAWPMTGNQGLSRLALPRHLENFPNFAATSSYCKLPPYAKSRLLSVGIFFARSPCNGAVPCIFLLSGLTPKPHFFARRTPFSATFLSLFSVGVLSVQVMPSSKINGLQRSGCEHNALSVVHLKYETPSVRSAWYSGLRRLLGPLLWPQTALPFPGSGRSALERSSRRACHPPVA